MRLTLKRVLSKQGAFHVPFAALTFLMSLDSFVEIQVRPSGGCGSVCSVILVSPQTRPPPPPLTKGEVKGRCCDEFFTTAAGSRWTPVPWQIPPWVKLEGLTVRHGIMSKERAVFFFFFSGAGAILAFYLQQRLHRRPNGSSRQSIPVITTEYHHRYEWKVSPNHLHFLIEATHIVSIKAILYNLNWQNKWQLFIYIPKTIFVKLLIDDWYTASVMTFGPFEVHLQHLKLFLLHKPIFYCKLLRLKASNNLHHLTMHLSRLRSTHYGAIRHFFRFLLRMRKDNGSRCWMLQDQRSRVKTVTITIILDSIIVSFWWGTQGHKLQLNSK